MKDYIYMYGQILATRSYVLNGEFPKPDNGGDIAESHFHMGGETATSSAILASLGCKVKMGGTHIGSENAKVIKDCCDRFQIDTTELVYNEEFGGIVDVVFISGSDRTFFAEWANIYARKDAWFEPMNEEAVKNSICVGFDPFLDSQDTSVVVYCKKYGKRYATIDCTFDSDINRYCEINAISHQYLKGVYGEDADFYDLHRKYTEESDGLIIFTCGENEVLYGRKGQEIKTFHPYQVAVKSTLGAGDSFKAGTVYALSKNLPDDEVVKYGCAVAGVAVTKYPITEKPPVIGEVEKLISNRICKTTKTN